MSGVDEPTTTSAGALATGTVLGQWAGAHVASCLLRPCYLSNRSCAQAANGASSYAFRIPRACRADGTCFRAEETKRPKRVIRVMSDLEYGSGYYTIVSPLGAPANFCRALWNLRDVQGDDRYGPETFEVQNYCTR
jgi:hypothetical protein